MGEGLFLQIWSPGGCWEVAPGPHGRRSSPTFVISTVAAPACTSVNSEQIFCFLHIVFSWFLRMLNIFKVINQPFMFGLLRTLLFACPVFITGWFAFLVFLFFFEFFVCSRNQHFVRCTAVKNFCHSVGYLLTGLCCLLLYWDLLVVRGPIDQLLLLMPVL